MAAQLPYLPPMISGAAGDIANVAAATARDVQAQATGAGKAGVVTRMGLPLFATAVKGVNDLTAAPVRAAVGGLVRPVQDFGSALFGLPQAAPAAPATHAAIVAGPAPAAGEIAASAKAGAAQGTSALVASPAAASSAVAPAGPAFAGLPPFVVHSPALAISEGLRQQASYAEAQRQAVLAGADQAAAAGNPNNASYRYAAALHALPTLSGSNDFARLQEGGAVNLNDVNERARASDLTAQAEAARTGVAQEANKLKAQELRRNAQLTKIGEIVNPDPATRPFAPKIDQYGYATIGADGKPEVYDMQGNRVNGPTPPAPAGPTVGAKVKQADGEYNRGGRTYVVKNGAIAEIK